MSFVVKRYKTRILLDIVRSYIKNMLFFLTYPAKLVHYRLSAVNEIRPEDIITINIIIAKASTECKTLESTRWVNWWWS